VSLLIYCGAFGLISFAVVAAAVATATDIAADADAAVAGATLLTARGFNLRLSN